MFWILILALHNMHLLVVLVLHSLVFLNINQFVGSNTNSIFEAPKLNAPIFHLSIDQWWNAWKQLGVLHTIKQSNHAISLLLHAALKFAMACNAQNISTFESIEKIYYLYDYLSSLVPLWPFKVWELYWGALVLFF